MEFPAPEHRKRKADDALVSGEWAMVPYVSATEGALAPFDTRNLVAYSTSATSFEEDSWEVGERQEIEDARGSEHPITGYVYAAENPFFGSLIKIGATTKSPYERLKTLSRTSVPEPFTLVTYISTFDPFGLEKRIHRYFSSKRKYGRKNEFFDLSHTEIFTFFEQLRQQQLYVQSGVFPMADQTVFKQSENESQCQDIQKYRFAFTYNGPKLHPTLLKAIKVKTYESCVDHDGFQYSLLHTLKPKRASWIESTINSWNEKYTTGDDDKIQLRHEELEPNIASFTKKFGETADDHYIVKTIRKEQEKGDGSTYERWDCDGSLE